MDFALKLLEKIGYPRINIANNDYQFYKHNPSLEPINPQFRRSKLLSFAFIGYFAGRPFGYESYAVFIFPLGYFLYSQILTYKNRDKMNSEFVSGLRMMNPGVKIEQKREGLIRSVTTERVGSYKIKVYDVEKLDLEGIERMVESLPREYFEA